MTTTKLVERLKLRLRPFKLRLRPYYTPYFTGRKRKLTSTFKHRAYAKYVLRFNPRYEKYTRSQLRTLPLARENVILVYPRSGSHWLRFIVEFLTGFPTNQEWIHSTKFSISSNVFPTKEHPLGHVRKELPPLYRRVHVVTFRRSAHDLLWPMARCIFLIRNPLDCIVRNHQLQLQISPSLNPKHYNPPEQYPAIQEFEHSPCKAHVHWWLNLLRTYDAFAGPKCIVWYPELIHEPEKVIRQISAFCGYDGPRLEMLIKNHRHYADLNRKGKVENRNWGGSISGDNLGYYANKEEFKQWRIWIEEELRSQVEGPDKNLSAYLSYFGWKRV